MKKRSYIALTISSLVLVLVVSFLFSQFVLPLIDDIFKNKPTYSETDCLTEQITENMDVYDIAKLYRDNNATIEVIGTFTENATGESYLALGSGVVVASNGYQTTTLSSPIKASKGSYITTNYHVIDFLYNSTYKNKTLSIRGENEVQYDCDVLWYDKNLDIALLYADVSYSYVKMVDRWVDCEIENKLDYEGIFAIGSPLQTQYLNRLTLGNVASNNDLVMFTAQYVYPYVFGGELKYSLGATSSSQTATLVLDNVYENVIDISLGISGGNSGGGCFDMKGNLIGLTTLASSVESTGGNQMNGAVPIYPIIKVLDKLISNKEYGTSYKIYNLKNIGLEGIDSEEAYYTSYFKEEEEYSYYFVNDKFYNSNFRSLFDFDEEGYCILVNNNSYSSLSNIKQGDVITSCKINNGSVKTIKNRNDLIYVLLQISEGDNLTITSKTDGLFGIEKTINSTVTF